MGYSTRILLAIVASLLAHGVLMHWLDQLPAHAAVRRPQLVTMEVVRTLEPEPQPEPEPLPEPEKPPPTPPPEVVHEVPRKRPPKRKRAPHKQVAKPPRDVPPPNTVEPQGPTTDTPVFGFNLASTSAAGTGPAMPVGNTLETAPDTKKRPPSKAVRALAPPVPAFEVTIMPKMAGRCRGRYSAEAREAGVEGTVVLDLIVGADGRTRDVKVVEGLGHGLDKAAVTALLSCRFRPGRRGKVAVAVRLRAFKIRFFLDDAD